MTWRGTYVMCDARNLMSPNIFLLQRMMRIALSQKMLKEAHILKTKQRNLVMWLQHFISSIPTWLSTYKYLMCNLRRRRILALQSRLCTMSTRRTSLLTLDTSPLAIIASPPALSMASPLKSLFLQWRCSNGNFAAGIWRWAWRGCFVWWGWGWLLLVIGAFTEWQRVGLEKGAVVKVRLFGEWKYSWHEVLWYVHLEVFGPESYCLADDALVDLMRCLCCCKLSRWQYILSAVDWLYVA